MPSVKCKRCGMTFPIIDEPHVAKRSKVCEADNCTRSYSEKNVSNKVRHYQTPKNVISTIKAAQHRYENNFQVDNGGCQEGTINK